MKKMIILMLLLSFVGCQQCFGTLSNTSNRSSLATGDGSTVNFTFTFPIIATSELEVWLRTTSTGAQEQQTLTTEYSVSATNNNFTSGGTVTMVTAPTTAQKLLILRTTPQTQATDFGASGIHLAIENADDKLTRILIDIQEQLNRSLKFPKTDASTLTSIMDDSVTRASQRLGFNSSGEPAIFSSGIDAGSTTVPSYFNTVIEGSSSEAAFKILTNLESGLDIQAWDAQLDDIAALSPSDNDFIVASGTGFVVESGTTAATRLSSGLGDIAGLTLSDNDFIVVSGTSFVVESGTTAIDRLDAGLGSIADLQAVTDTMLYATATDTFALTTITGLARNLLDDETEADMQTTLGVTANVFVPSTYAGEQSITFPNGLILKVGTENVAGDTEDIVTFSTPFPNAFVNGQVSFNEDNTALASPAACQGATSTIEITNGDASTRAIFWQAWGY